MIIVNQNATEKKVSPASLNNDSTDGRLLLVVSISGDYAVRISGAEIK